MKTVRPTIYYLALETEYSTENRRGVFQDKEGKIIYSGSEEFLAAVKMEGSGKLADGRVINVAGSIGGFQRFHFPKNAPYGQGARCALLPMRSVAVDRNHIPLGSILKIPKTIGLKLPDGSSHDGIWYALDVGGAIKGDRIDIFAGVGKASMKQIYQHGIDHKKPLEYEIVGVMATCPPVPGYEAPPIKESPVIKLTSEKLISEMTALYQTYVGKTEDKGFNRSGWIDQLNQFTKVQLGSPYCLSGLQYGAHVLESRFNCDLDIPITAHCQSFYAKVKPHLKHQEPKAGDWGIFKRMGSSSGHAVYVKEVLGKGKIRTIEFNTGPEAFMNREGDGCWEKTRDVAGYGIKRLMGFVRIADSLAAS